MNLFRIATQSNWYLQFLEPVLNEVERTENVVSVLDVGTGYGNLAEMIASRNPQFKITATDNDITKININKAKNIFDNIRYVHDESTLRNLKAESYDVVIFCSILFLLPEPLRNEFLDEAIRMLTPKGKIIVLTPTGSGNWLSPFAEMCEKVMGRSEFTYVIWRLVTRRAAHKWDKVNWLQEQSSRNGMSYSGVRVFDQNAILEILGK